MIVEYVPWMRRPARLYYKVQVLDKMYLYLGPLLFIWSAKK